MKKFNLTEIALNNKSVIVYFIIVVIIAGLYSYNRLGRMEDPDFVIRQMVISTVWPGATALQMEQQVTDKLEKKLQETPYLDYIKSVSRPEQSIIYVILREDRPSSEVRPTWLEVRNMLADIKMDLPHGIVGPFFNDRFDDVFGSVYALTTDGGFSYEEMRESAERIRRQLLEVKSVKKINLLGVQTEAIYIETDSTRLAQLNLPITTLINAITSRNAVTPAGMVETSSKNIYLRLTGEIDDLSAIHNIPIQADDHVFRLGDVAKVTRGYVEPATDTMFFNGKPAVGLAIAMEEGNNILELGKNLAVTVEHIKRDLPAGLSLEQVVNQPQVVTESINDFIASLQEAVIIVLVVSLLSLGLRTGLVVALCIPLVLAGVFLSMEILGIALHKVSLGALIIALGLLVDDEIIAVEMMAVKLESGLERFKAACAAYNITAIPMLTGTLVTCAGFIPIGFAQGMTAEFTYSLFVVVTLALLISWIVSVMITPLLGFYLIKIPSHNSKKEHVYSMIFYGKFRQILSFCLIHKGKVVILTTICLILSIFMMTFIKQEFFPSSVRKEIIVDMTLPAGSSIQDTAEQAKRFALYLDQEEGVESYSYYVGSSAPRFVLTIEPVLPVSDFAQFVVVAKDLKSRQALITKIDNLFKTDFPNVMENITVIQTGPSSPYPVMLRVSGYDIQNVKEIAYNVAAIMREDPNIHNVNFDWNEQSGAAFLAIDHDKLQALGVDKQTLSLMLQAYINGTKVAEFYEDDKTVDMILRLVDDNRNNISQLKDLPIQLPSGDYISLDQLVSTITFGSEEVSIWRRNLKPTITVRANIYSGTSNDMTMKLFEDTQTIRDRLSFGYSIEIDGDQEQSDIALNAISEQLPLMFLVIFTILMFQLKKISLSILALVSAAFGLIGVSWTMLLFNQPMGFVAQLGVLSLSGMIIRNSIILLDQIKRHQEEGENPWEAIINSAIFRFRPIMLTAAAAILAMIPLMRSGFWSAMAFAIAGGLAVATVLTLIVLPCLYALLFKITPQKSET